VGVAEVQIGVMFWEKGSRLWRAVSAMLAFGWAGEITQERATRNESQLVQPEISTKGNNQIYAYQCRRLERPRIATSQHKKSLYHGVCVSVWPLTRRATGEIV
jgi:hypothetical protein